MDEARIVGKFTRISLRHLQLDPENPRLASEREERTPDRLARILEMGHETLVLAESIARHGFFANEPLIALEADENGVHTVVEGNRRLLALRGLAIPEVRARFFERPKWDALAQDAGFTADTEVPVTIVASRSQVYSIIGFRHISGILDWSPYAQAAYITDLVEKQGYSLDSVSEMIGKKKTDTANLYRNFCIVRQAAEVGADVAGAEDSFSLMTVAMGSANIRDFVGAPRGSALEPGVHPIPVERVPQLKEVLSWIFGAGELEAVIDDSREISALGKVIADERGLASLRHTRDLAEAKASMKDTAMDPRVRLVNRLQAARNALRSAADDIADFSSDREVSNLLQDIQEELDGLAAFVSREEKREPI